LTTSTKLDTKADTPPRQRILDAACELFYSRGIRAVSVDEIAAAAQTNKMTLYRHFKSKDELVAEYLRALNAHAIAGFEEAMRGCSGDPYAQLRAFIARIGGELCKPASLRGCPMANAAVEFPEKDHPARAVIEESKNQQRNRLVKLCREAEFVEPEQLAEQLFLLFEGACVNVQSLGNCGPGARFTEMAYALMESQPRRAQQKT